MANGLLVSVYDAGGNLVTVKRFEEFWDIKPIIDAAFTLNCQVLIEQDGPEEEPEEEDTILSHLIEAASPRFWKDGRADPAAQGKNEPLP